MPAHKLRAVPPLLLRDQQAACFHPWLLIKPCWLLGHSGPREGGGVFGCLKAGQHDVEVA